MKTVAAYISAHKLLIAGLVLFLVGFAGITLVVANASIVFSHLSSEPAMQAANAMWRQFGHRYTAWLMIPPPLRPACDWVDTEVCRLTGTIHDASSWQQYMGNLLAVAVFTLVILAAGFIIRWLASRLIELVRGSATA